MNEQLTRGRDPFAARVGLGLRELDGQEQAPDVSEAVRRRLGGAGSSSLETPRRRPVLLLLAALLALAVTATLMWQSRSGGAAGQEAGQQDPQATQLVYRTAEAPETAQREALLEALRQRLGELGTATCEGRTVTIRVVDAAKAQQVRELVEGHRLEMRAVAYGDYQADAGALGGEVRFDLAAERARLQAWLDAGGAARLREDPRAIEQFSAKSPWLRWYPRLLRPDPSAPERWDYSWTKIPDLQNSTVAAFRDADWNYREMPAAMRELPVEQRFLIELLAVNMHEEHFSDADLDPKAASVGDGPNGTSAMNYAVLKDKRQAYQQLTARYVGRCLATLWDGEALSAPVFNGPIPGVGLVHGLSPETIEDAVRIIRNPLPLPLEFVR